MNPDDVVLVALMNSPRDFEIVTREHWYRIPARSAPKFFSGAQYLAFYFTRAFGDKKWSISDYAPVRGHELARRRDLLPNEPDHPRADEPYYKLQLGSLDKREPPIVSKRGRRVLFVWTTWGKFSTAREFNDLFGKSPMEDKLWEALKQDNVDAEREMIVREGRSRYRADFLIICPRGQLAVNIGPPPASKNLRALSFSEEELTDHFERALNQIRRQVRELSENYPARERAKS
jgi:hypothetical protein